jgi:hypothetical protein
MLWSGVVFVYPLFAQGSGGSGGSCGAVYAGASPGSFSSVAMGEVSSGVPFELKRWLDEQVESLGANLLESREIELIRGALVALWQLLRSPTFSRLALGHSPNPDELRFLVLNELLTSVGDLQDGLVDDSREARIERVLRVFELLSNRLIEFYFNKTPGVEVDVVVEHQRILVEQEEALVDFVKEFKIKIEGHLFRYEYEEAFKSLSNFKEQNPPEIWEMALSVIDLNVQDNDGWTALMWAAFGGHLEVVRLLIAKKTDLNIRNNLGDTALMLAAVKGHTEVVKLLIAAGAAVNDRDNDGGTALMWAAFVGRLEVVRFLIAAGAAVNDRDNDGRTALMRAASGGHLEVVRFLIAAGTDLNVQDNDGRTALMLAAQKGHTKVVMLIEEALRRQAEALSAAGEGDVDASP